MFQVNTGKWESSRDRYISPPIRKRAQQSLTKLKYACAIAWYVYFRWFLVLVTLCCAALFSKHVCFVSLPRENLRLSKSIFVFSWCFSECVHNFLFVQWEWIETNLVLVYELVILIYKSALYQFYSIFIITLC